MLNKFSVPLMCGFLLVISTAFGQDTNIETIKVDTRLVSVPVIVSDRNGHYVPNLTTADFSILQDGKPQKTEFFAAIDEALTIAVLIDTSQSTRPVLGDIKDSAKSFVKLLNPQDRAMIVSFDYETHILSGLSSDKKQLEKAVKSAEIPKTFGTTLRDAAFETVNQSFAGIKGRKAIIILTDGKDAGSRTSSRELLHTLEESDTLIYTIMFKTGNQRQPERNARGGRNGGVFGGSFPGGGRGGRGGGMGRFPRPRPQQRPQNPRRTERIEEKNSAAAEFLQKLSETTAGRFFSSNNGKLKDKFAEILDELRSQYRLGFYPPDGDRTDSLHELKVKVDKPDLVVRARYGYRTATK